MHKKTIKRLFPLLIILIILPASAGLSASLPVATTPAPTGAQIGVYDDTTYGAEGGVWDTGLSYILQMLSTYGYTYECIGPEDINSTSDLNSYFQTIIFGGGWAGSYMNLIDSSGFANLRRFVKNGGGFFGICAGAYLACELVIWKEYRSSPLEIYPYPLKLFKGAGVGPVFAIKGWHDTTGCSANILEGAETATLTLNPELFPDFESDLSMLYYGGPLFQNFHSDFESDGVQTAATYNTTAAMTDGRPAMIYFTFGSGRVFLTGPHPEVMFQNCEYSISATNWAFMEAALQLLDTD